MRTSLTSFTGTAPGAAARWAVRLSLVVSVIVTSAALLIGLAIAARGAEAIEDNWLGATGAAVIFGGLGGSLLAMALGIVAKVRGERVRLLWLPLALFPVLFATVLIGEVLFLE